MDMKRQTASLRQIEQLLRRSVTALPAAAALVLAVCCITPSLAIVPSLEIVPVAKYTPGRSYFGRNNYIEYIAGNSPLILSAPHGGHLTPIEIRDRSETCGASVATSADLNTRELVIAMQRAIHTRFGVFPHVVINHLHRSRLDANRPVTEAACGSREAGIAWLEFHRFLDTAKLAVVNGQSKGWYMDMHGHGHAIQRLELGYLLSAAELRQADSVLDAMPVFENASSINTLSKDNRTEPFSMLLRGPNSLGALYAANNYPAVPSSTDPFPRNGEAYFNGGFSTERHTCGTAASPLGGLPGGNICGVQIETNFTGVRDTADNRARFAEVTASILETYLATQWDIRLRLP
jgi:hypothetical protein